MSLYAIVEALTKNLLGEKRTCAKFQSDILTQLVTLIIFAYILVYILEGLRRFLLGVTNFIAHLIYSVQDIKTEIIVTVFYKCSTMPFSLSFIGHK